MVDPLVDGNSDFLGGQDASKTPDKIAANAIASGINITTKNGSLGPRWGWDEKQLDFSNTGSYTRPNLEVISYEDVFYKGKFQAKIPYCVGNVYYQLWVVSGILFLINQDTYQVSVIPIEDGTYIGEDKDRVNWSPASKYLVIYDFPARPVIIEGYLARRADPALDEIPISDNGVYNQNRLFISNAGNEFTAGDPTGIGFPRAPITFEEILTPSTGFTGQSFQLSTNYNNDPLTAMIFLQVVDTSTGIGPMLVSTQNGIWSYQTQNPRDQWEQGQFGACLVYNNGIVGPQAVVNVNSDVFYMSPDLQVRSLSMSRDEQASWSKVGMSREVQNWLKANYEEQVQLTHISYFENKLFVTANPFYMTVTSRDGEQIPDTAFGGFTVMEMDNISNLSNKSSPVWAGLWTGLYPMQTSINNKRFFIAAKRNGKNAFFEATPQKTVDIVDGKERLIRSRFYTRLYSGGSPTQDKRLQSTQIQLPKVRGKFYIKIKYRPSIGDTFADYRELSHEAPYQICDTVPEGKLLNGLAPHSFASINFGSPNEIGCNEVTQTSFVTFKKLQYQVTITGRDWEISQFMMRSMMSPQNEQIDMCSGFKQVEIPQECFDDWVVTENDLCL